VSETLATSLESQNRLDEARRYRSRSRLVRIGEPLNLLVVVVNGIQYELNEIGSSNDERIQFAFERNRITLRPATELTRQGEQLGSQGKYEESLDFFRDAARAKLLAVLSRLKIGHYLDGRHPLH
jgi:hypothetical protein